MTNPTNTEFHVPGMSCGHCESAVKAELAKVPGVADVAVDLDTKIVSVTGTELNRDSLIAAIDEAGYDTE